MTNLEITSFAKTLCEGLKQYLKNENIKINDADFQELENILINEFNLPYSDQTPVSYTHLTLPTIDRV